ncbi:45210311-c543-4651-9f01-3e3b37a97e15 [Thermothielavioides terrestris]|uniref:Homoaconitase, mitochondrial n=1 Tax=Thermothielavioides terrestris TaxID=2587410 RepID=A0A3S4DAP2_9PEZI|nr:45210311-c543-4651-9f01-3e3b37a97e15 [Thermothielavioides terrestris]
MAYKLLLPPGTRSWCLPSRRHMLHHAHARFRFASTTASASRSPQTLTEKIVQRYAVGLPEGKRVRSGDYIRIEPHYCMTHDNSWPVATKFMSLGATKVNRPQQLVMALDHDVQNTSPANLKKYQQIQAFAAQHGVDFYPAGRGIGHQIMVEEGYAWPGTLAVASDSHSTHYGGVGCLGTPVVRTDAASIWATSQTWWRLPPVARVTFTGTLPAGVTPKDVIVALCGLFKDDVLNHAVEFTGSEETMASLPVDGRLTIANMSCEWGALTGLFPIDRTLERWLRQKAAEASALNKGATQQRFTQERIDELFANPLRADPDAVYAKQLYLNLSTLSPYVSGPNSVKVITPLAELARQNIKVDRAYVVSCTNSRASDLAAAAKVFRDAAKANPGTPPKIAPGVRFYIAAASAPEQQTAEAAGDWQTLLDAGAQPLPAGIQVGISASNRNFKGRMGSRDAHAYLASPEVVAASALRGTIAGPDVYQVPADWSGVDHGYGVGAEPTVEDKLANIVQQLDSLVERVESAVAESDKTQTEILPGFPEKITGEILWLDADNLSTDGIYPGTLTYRDDVTKDEMARACMQNYDPDFGAVARPGDILVSGFNFGTGSSREQAATAILAKQIPLVVAGSFGNIFARNAINNALPNLEVPRLVERLRAHFSSSSSSSSSAGAAGAPGEQEEKKKSAAEKKPAAVLTRRTGWTLTWDVRRSVVEVREGDGPKAAVWSEKVGELPAPVQAIIAAGGLEAWTKAEVARSAGGSA